MAETYTAEDFENAEFARCDDGSGFRAMKTAGGWLVGAGTLRTPLGPFNSGDMAGNGGWVPVSTSAADNDRRVERLKRQVTEQDITICRRNRQIEELNRRIRALEEVEAAPEPWQALADEMEELYDGYSLRAAEAAQFLHERGVRVVGGDDE